MQQVSDRNFGLLIAYIVPGFLALIGVSVIWPTVGVWLSIASVEQMPTVAGFLYITIASIGMGMTVSAIRWITLDQVHEHTGVPRPIWDDAKLQDNYDAFLMVVEHHYRHYQFHGNSLVSMMIVYVARLMATEISFGDGTEVALLVLGAVFFKASRNNLKRYYSRASVVMQHSEG